MIDRFNKIVDYFIHPRLKVDKSVYEKNRVYILAFAIILGFNILYLSFYLFQGEHWSIKALHNYLAIVLSVTGLSIIKFSGKSKLALFIGAIVGFYLIVASACLAGGIKSNDFLWFAVLSAAAFMFIGIKEGIFFSFLSVIVTTFFFVSDNYNWIEYGTNALSLSIAYKYFNYTLLLIVLALMVFVLVRSNQKLQEIVQLNKEQKIREEIARDFHDQIGNKLASIMHLSELMKIKKEDAEKKEIAKKIDFNAKYVYDNFKDFIWTLDAKSDKLTELFMYLRDFADDYFKFSDVNLYITSSPENLPDIILPSYYSKEIVPLFKEAITNVYKHSFAKNVSLSFSILHSQLIIKLTDDGKGIDSSFIKKGNGLRNMQHRAKKTGGDLKFNTSAKGTEVTYAVLLPIKGS